MRNRGMGGEEAEGEGEMGLGNTRWLASSQKQRLADERLWTQCLNWGVQSGKHRTALGLYLYSVLNTMGLLGSSVGFEDS